MMRLINRFWIIPILLMSIFLVGCQDKDYFLIGSDNSSNSTLYEEDLRFPVSAIKITGSVNLPTFGTFMDKTQILYFGAQSMDQAFLTAQFPHAMIDSSVIEPHYHWTYIDEQASGDVVWCMEFTCANINIIFPAPTNITCVVDTAVAPFYHHMTDMINISNDFTKSAMCAIRIFRNATDTRDTFNADAGLLEYDIHYLNYFYGSLE